MDSRMANLTLKKYKKTIWKDNLVEYPDRIKLKPENEEEGLYTVIDAEGEVFEEGTPVNMRIMNNIEDGIENNNKYILATIQDVKTLQLQVLILQAVITGGVNGEVYMENFDKINVDNLKRGIYDEDDKCIYCIDSNGDRVELTGYGIAIG